MTAPLQPPSELRGRVLAAVRSEPVADRSRKRKLDLLVVVAGFVPTVAISVFLGGPGPGSNLPCAYTVALSVAWLFVGLIATWEGVTRGRSMLGRSPKARWRVAVLTPVALLLAAAGTAIAWPSTLDDVAGLRAHLVCVVFTLLFAAGPLAGFAIVRRRSDPVAPRLTGAAIGAAAGAWGALGIEMHCGHTAATHIVIGHVLPVVLLTVVGIAVGDRVIALKASS